MKRLVSFVMFLVIVGIGFSGVISGNLIYPEGTDADTFLLIVTDQFEDLMSAALGTTIYPFEWSVTGDFSDTTDFYAFAGLTSAATLIPMSGDPAGVYPHSPFRTVGGSASGIDIPIATSADIPGSVQWSGSFDDVYINIYDLYPAYIIGDSVLEVSNIPVGADGRFLVEGCPTGPKAVVAYIDENENGEFDEGEPHAWLDNELMGVLVVGGGYDAEILPEQLNLDLWFVKEATPKPTELNMIAYPNPFNNAINIYYTADVTGECRIEIYDSKGLLVNTLFSGVSPAGRHVVSWDGRGLFGQELSSGIYTIKLSSTLNTVSTKVIYIK